MAVVVEVGINTNVSLPFQCYIGKCTAHAVFTKSDKAGVDPISPHTYTQNRIFDFRVLISSIAIILMGKRQLIALLNLSSWCLVMVERLFLAVPRGCLQFVMVVFPDHTHLLFLM